MLLFLLGVTAQFSIAFCLIWFHWKTSGGMLDYLLKDAFSCFDSVEKMVVMLPMQAVLTYYTIDIAYMYVVP